jgi:hypothetical protein
LEHQQHLWRTALVPAIFTFRRFRHAIFCQLPGEGHQGFGFPGFIGMGMLLIVQWSHG